MKNLCPLFLVVSLGLFACQANQVSLPTNEDPLSGTWLGDFGDGYFDRNTIRLELEWNGKNLTGMVKPGDPRGRMYRNFTPFAIQKASFESQTGTIKFEALFEPRGRAYLIEGKVAGDTMKGTWDRPTDLRSGDFRLTRQETK